MNTLPLVLVLANPSDRCQALQAEFLRAGLETRVLHTSEELHRVVMQQPPDALVLENQLEGFFSGLEIAERLDRQLTRPPTVLIGSLNPADRARAAILKISHLADWSDGIVSLREAMQAAMAAEALAVVRIPAAAREVVQNTDFIRPMPQLVVRVAEYLSDETASTADLAREIAVDPKVTADVLRLVNSTAYGTKNQVVRLSDAVSLLGIRRIASVVITTTLQQIQSDFEKHLADDLMTWYRMRSLLMASAASAFAKLSQGVSRDYVYTLGLLQDLGILALAYRLGRRHLHLIDRCRSLAPLCLETCERQELSFTHAEVSAALIQKWGMPNSIISLVLAHHAPGADSGLSSAEGACLHLMQVGESLSNMIDVPSPQRYARLKLLLRVYPNASPASIKLCLSEAVSAATGMKKLFQIPVPHGADWDQLVHQIHADLQHPASTQPDPPNDPPAPRPASRFQWWRAASEQPSAG